MSGQEKQLLQTIKVKKIKIDLDLLKLAIEFASNAHDGQKRKTGEPYIVHSLATAETLASMGMDENTILAGILHDVPEDTHYSLEDIEKNFGKDVAGLVAGITKLGAVKYRGVDRYVENLRRMFIAMAEDIRVILIKFADRLHNLKTLYAHPPHKRERIAKETLEIYAPIANRLGMGEIKGQLEDLAFQYAYPDEYAWLQGQIIERHRQLERHLKIIQKQLALELKKHKIDYISIHGRNKHLYSLYQKVLLHDRDINKIYDLIASRVIVNNISDCYTVLGIIHERWTPLKGRIKDYIAQPKPNGYQSLHTSIFCDHGEVIEFQIRTQQMHEESEFGIAAHWHYSENKESSLKKNKKLAWIKELSEWKKETAENQKYLEHLKLNVFQNRIFVFTPKGDVIDLPEGASVIDFAYHVHTQIGNTCTGARINGNIASLDSQLKSGDMCEIIIDKNRKSPNPDWVNFAKTNTAKNHIRSSNRRLLPLPSIWDLAKKVRGKN